MTVSHMTPCSAPMAVYPLYSVHGRTKGQVELCAWFTHGTLVEIRHEDKNIKYKFLELMKRS